MAKRESKPENESTSETVTPTPPVGSLPTEPPSQSEQLLKQYEGQIAQLNDANERLERENTTIRKLADGIEDENRRLRQAIEKMARDRAETPPSQAENFRDPICIDRHASGCRCTGEMRGPV